ncbi:MAG: 1,2-phenylacetyl-CoA epoxidase subunit PaaC [Bacteroidia bacterium]
MQTEAIKDLLYRLADDKIILGHRNSEWVGIGPVLEEDIAFASMAQDEIGHAWSYFQLLEELGETDPDTNAFMRPAEEYHCCHLVEYPIGDYAFSLVRHYLFDMADKVRLKHLSESSYKPLAELAYKIAREEKYHQMHARVFLEQLGKASQESNQKLQTALNEVYPIAFGIFEPTVFSEVLAAERVQPLEDTLMKEWRMEVESFLRNCGLIVPPAGEVVEHFGGRTGHHTQWLSPLLAEMTEVFAIDPHAKW